MRRHSHARCCWGAFTLEMPLASVTSSAGQQGATQLTGWLYGTLVPRVLGPGRHDGIPRDSGCSGTGALVRQNKASAEVSSCTARGPWLVGGARAGPGSNRPLPYHLAEGHVRLHKSPRVRVPAWAEPCNHRSLPAWGGELGGGSEKQGHQSLASQIFPIMKCFSAQFHLTLPAICMKAVV